MAIPNFRKSLKLRLPRRLRSKANTVSPPPETATSSDEEVSTTRKAEDAFRQVFEFLDTNSDGRISVDELRSYFTSIGEAMSVEDVEKIIKEFSNGGDLLLGYEEFVKMMELRDGMEEDDDDKVLRQAFEVYEEEKGSGCITPKGLQEVLRRLGDVKSHQECEAIIRVFDLDGNGVLDFHEFQMMMTA